MCSSGRLKVTREFGYVMDTTKRLTVAELKAEKQKFMDMMAKAEGRSADPPVCVDAKHFDADALYPGGLNYFDNPTSWPYILHDTDESPFNLNHGYMWGRYAGFGV